jgi:hypothetical protein
VLFENETQINQEQLLKATAPSDIRLRETSTLLFENALMPSNTSRLKNQYIQHSSQFQSIPTNNHLKR